MRVVEATRRYEAWLGAQMPLVAADLERKHDEMAHDPFRFMRATFYRWAQRWRHDAGDSADATAVLAVGDLHVENFGTWRDADGRLVWGINDFDEATTLPWTFDLVRLATSVALAIRGEHIGLSLRQACEALAEGYAEGVASDGRPYVLEEEHGWLRRVALGKLRSPVAFWSHIDGLPGTRRSHATVTRLLAAALPDPSLQFRLCHRSAGLGSLGRPRFVAIAEWRGGRVAREAKALAPSAWTWATGRRTSRIRYDEVIRQAIRVPDPWVKVEGTWVVRRLAPHCTRIELADLPDERDECRLLHAMGFETANVHLGTDGAARSIARERRTLTARKLAKLARRFADAVEEDWQDFRKEHPP